MRECDVLIVGAGFSGLVIAERFSSIGKHCIVVEKRSHIGGNAYDCVNEAGVLVHPYGSHLFHTNSDKVYNYLSQFTEWLQADYRSSSYVDGKFYSFPLNLTTFEQIIGAPSSPDEFQEYLEAVRVPIEHPKNSEEAIISRVGWDLYEKFYKGYTIKQWGRHPRDLDASVCLRLPIRTRRYTSYFDDTYQCMPANGYTVMFRQMLHKSPGIEVMLDTDYRDLRASVRYNHMVYTGPIDEYFGYREGHLPYRTLKWDLETFYEKEFFQPTISVNYPTSERFTRIIEIKHATQQKCENTTIMREYSEAWTPGKEPFYPVPAPDADKQYRVYQEMAYSEENVTFLGRLARYKYLNMDQVVGAALHEFEKLKRFL